MRNRSDSSFHNSWIVAVAVLQIKIFSPSISFSFYLHQLTVWTRHFNESLSSWVADWSSITLNYGVHNNLIWFIKIWFWRSCNCRCRRLYPVQHLRGQSGKAPWFLTTLCLPLGTKACNSRLSIPDNEKKKFEIIKRYLCPHLLDNYLPLFSQSTIINGLPESPPQ